MTDPDVPTASAEEPLPASQEPMGTGGVAPVTEGVVETSSGVTAAPDDAAPLGTGGVEPVVGPVAEPAVAPHTEPTALPVVPAPRAQVDTPTPPVEPAAGASAERPVDYGPVDGPLDPFPAGYADSVRPNSRKGTSGRTVLVAFGIGLLVAVLSVVGVAFVKRSNAAITVATVNTTYSDTQSTLTFEVTKRAQDGAVCVVQALDLQFTVLGETDAVQVPPGMTKTTVTTVVQTSKKANIVQVDSCSVQSH